MRVMLMCGMSVVSWIGATPEGWLLLTDGSRLAGHPIGRNSSAVVWQLSDGDGYAEVPIPVESIQAIQWRLPLTNELDGALNMCAVRNRYLDLLAAADKFRLFEHWARHPATNPGEFMEFIKTLQGLRGGRVPADLLRRIVEEECIALVQLQLAGVALETVGLLSGSDASGEMTALVHYLHAAAALEEGAVQLALQHAVAGFMRYGADDDRWRSKCAALAIRLMAANGMLENARLMRQSAESQRLMLDAVATPPGLDGGGVE